MVKFFFNSSALTSTSGLAELLRSISIRSMNRSFFGHISSRTCVHKRNAQNVKKREKTISSEFFLFLVKLFVK